MISVQRAFVFVKEYQTVVINDTLRVVAIFENSGSTLAIPLKNWINWKVFPNNTSSISANYPDFDAIGNPAVNSRADAVTTYLGPHSHQLSGVLVIPIPTIKLVESGNSRVFIWGWIEYNDVFDGTNQHRTEFCDELIVEDINSIVIDDKKRHGVSFTNCRMHNSAK